MEFRFTCDIVEVGLIGKSVNAPKFLGALEKGGWFISYTIMLAEKHFEDPENKRIIVSIVLLGDYLWNVQTVRFEEVIYEAERTRRHKIDNPPEAIREKAFAEITAAMEKAKELPAKIKKRLVEAQEAKEATEPT